MNAVAVSAARLADVRVERRLHVVQGEFRVSADPDVVLVTVLGSCVAACAFDPATAIGGMNHFLLPGAGAQDRGGDARRFGAYAMELLVNELLKSGARRDRLRVKLFGGARLLDGLRDVGDQNAAFAEGFLHTRTWRSPAGACAASTRAGSSTGLPPDGRARRS